MFSLHVLWCENLPKNRNRWPVPSWYCFQEFNCSVLHWAAVIQRILSSFLPFAIMTRLLPFLGLRIHKCFCGRQHEHSIRPLCTTRPTPGSDRHYRTVPRSTDRRDEQTHRAMSREIGSDAHVMLVPAAAAAVAPRPRRSGSVCGVTTACPLVMPRPTTLDQVTANFTKLRRRISLGTVTGV